MSQNNGHDSNAQGVAVISAAHGGNAQLVLEEIIHARDKPFHHARVFGQEAEQILRGSGECCGDIHVREKKGSIPVILRLISPHQISSAEQAGIVLVDTNQMRTWSCKPLQGSMRRLGIKRNITLSQSHISHIATAIIACWVIRGHNWVDRAHNTFEQPYGLDPSPENHSSRKRRKRRHHAHQPSESFYQV